MKRILYLVFALSVVLSTWAEDVLRVVPLTTSAGVKASDKKYIEIELTNNSFDVANLQFDIKLPVGMNLTGESRLTGRVPSTYKSLTGKYEYDFVPYSAYLQETGFTRFVFLPQNNLQPISMGTGVILQLGYTTDANMAAGTYSVVIDNTKLVQSPTEGIYLNPSTSQITIIESAFLEGDVNGDGSVDIGDIVMVISVMTGTETDATIVARADVNSDDAADIGDIVSIISIMTGQPAGARANATARIWQQENSDRVSMTMEDNALHLSLDNSRDYTAFQFQLTLPEGTSSDDVTISSLRGQGHVATVEPMGNGQYLVMGYSLGNKNFNGYSGELLTLNLKGQQTDQVAIDNVIFADVKGQTYRLMGGEATGVGQIDNGKLKMDNSVYDLQGRKVTIGKNGIYLVGNKKVVVK